jgi:hypothetical protein
MTAAILDRVLAALAESMRKRVIALAKDDA